MYADPPLPELWSLRSCAAPRLAWLTSSPQTAPTTLSTGAPRRPEGRPAQHAGALVRELARRTAGDPTPKPPLPGAVCSTRSRRSRAPRRRRSPRHHDDCDRPCEPPAYANGHHGQSDHGPPRRVNLASTPLVAVGPRSAAPRRARPARRVKYGPWLAVAKETESCPRRVQPVGVLHRRDAGSRAGLVRRVGGHACTSLAPGHHGRQGVGRARVVLLPWVLLVSHDGFLHLPRR
jgi:hypothetical protein